MVSKYTRKTAVNRKVALLVKYLVANYNLDRDFALRYILRTKLYNSYLVNTTTDLWLSPLEQLIEFLEVERRDGADALIQYLDKHYFY